jgi:hypothetical protein
LFGTTEITGLFHKLNFLKTVNLDLSVRAQSAVLSHDTIALKPINEIDTINVFLKKT